MGAWSSGPFDNDEALDFMDELAQAPEWAKVEFALRTALAEGQYLETTEGSAAVAAAALIALFDPHCGLAAEPDFDELRSQLGPPRTALARLASTAVARIVGPGSELAELWTESADADEWFEKTANIQKSLSVLS